jgi:uncharacterized protein (TIGR03382 family)
MTQGFLRPVLDLEENVMRDQNNQPDPFYEPLTPANLTLWAETFIDRIEDLTGAEPIVYMNSTFARDNLLTSFNEHDLWLARYSIGHPNSVDPETSNPENPGASWANPYGIWNDPIGGEPSHDSWSFWQYSNAGVGSTYGATSQFIDLDLFNGSMAQLQAEFVIPEPGAMTLAAAIGFAALARRRRRR